MWLSFAIKVDISPICTYKANKDLCIISHRTFEVSVNMYHMNMFCFIFQFIHRTKTLVPP